MLKNNKLIFLVGIVILIFYYKYLSIPEKRLKKSYLIESYSGKVVDLFLEKNNHRAQILVLENGQRVYFPRHSFHLFDSIKIGDYIYKEEGTLEAFVRVDTGIIFRIPYRR